MRRGLGVGALVAILVLPGLMAVASARRAAIAEPQTIELTFGPADPQVDVSADYHLRAPEWRKGGLSMSRSRVSDQDGTAVGNVVWNCISSKVAWLCDLVLTLKDGPYTDLGQIMVSGHFRGFSGERFAVIGGTGPYANVRGEATLTYGGGDDWHVTLELLP
jgi:hypothetical protein